MTVYIRHSLVAFALLAAFVAAFNIWADPYNIYRFQGTDADRMSRIDQTYTMRLSKPWQLIQARPAAVVIGSSRSASIHPVQEKWLGKPSFNLSMAGLTLHEMLRSIEHAYESGPLSELVIGLEYETFISSDYETGLGFADGRLATVGSLALTLQAGRDIGDTLFTTSALSRSLQAITRDRPLKKRYYPDGSWTNNSPVWRGRSGYISVGKNLVRLLHSDPLVYRKNLDLFTRILRYCHQRGITTTLFISPEHIFLTDLRRRASGSLQWQQFHRELATINERVAREQDVAPFPLWGFNQLDGIVNEPLPNAGLVAGAWFRDGIHFNRDLGKLLLEQMLQNRATPGYALHSGNIELYLAAVDQLQQRFLSKNRESVESYLMQIL
jgi:hypothetical protein